MNKIVITAVVLVVVGALGAGAYYMFGVSDVAMAQRALKGNGSVTCTFTDADTGDDGTLYVRDGDMRVDSMTTDGPSGSDDTATTTHMLLMNATMYIWADGEEEGVQFSVPDSDDATTGNQDVPFSDYEDEAELEREFERQQASCRRGADGSLFELPSGVDFVELSSFFDLFDDNMDDDFHIDFENNTREVPEEIDQLFEQFDHDNAPY